MKHILDSSIEDELDTWEKFLAKLATKPRSSWNSNRGVYLENRKGLTQLLSNVEDET
jgi:signal recognition particle subunit SEC65